MSRYNYPTRLSFDRRLTGFRRYTPWPSHSGARSVGHSERSFAQPSVSKTRSLSTSSLTRTGGTKMAGG